MSDSETEAEIDRLLREGRDPAEIAATLEVDHDQVRSRQEQSYEAARELAGSGLSDETVAARTGVPLASIPRLRAWNTMRAGGPIESQFDKITRENLLRAIADIDREGFPRELASRTYDLLLKGKVYPPKLVVAMAFKHATGTAIKTSEFNGGRDTRAFKLLEREGFRIVEKGRSSLRDLLIKFVRNVLLINEGPAEGLLKTKDYLNQTYRGLELSVSFGKGTFADVPFMAFLGHGQSVQRGINPVLLFSRGRAENNLEVCFGTSTTNPPDVPWNEDLVAGLPRSQSGRYEESFVKRAFTVNSVEHVETKADQIVQALDEVIDEYDDQFIDDADFREVCRSFDPAWVSFYLDRLRAGIADLGLSREGQKVVFSTKQRGLQFIVGGRYCFVLTRRDGGPHFGFASLRRLNESTTPFKGSPAVFYTKLHSIAEAEEFVDEPFEMAREALNKRDSVSGFRRFDDSEFRKSVFGGAHLRETKDEGMDRQDEIEPLNTIYYGPPGTGKTKTATDLIKKYEAGYRVKESVNLDVFLHDHSWWQIFALILDDLGGRNVEVAQITEHPLVQAKLRISKNKSIVQTVWGALMSHTSPDSQTVKMKEDLRYPPYVFDKNTDSTWNLTPDWQLELSETLEEFKKAKTTRAKMVKNTKFITFHQSYSYEDFVEGIKPVTNDKGQLTYEIRSGSFKSFCNDARIDPENKYLLVIDEINRGNISKIFGELITSIEDSKREGNAHCIPVELQYSREPFTVPKNVFVVGTMNTSDRSIATLDLALRRRFTFKPLYPNASEVRDVGAARVNAVYVKLNKRVQALLGADYQIGHTFFLGLGDDVADLKQVWFGKVLPLLHEYFYGDFAKLEALLPSFVEHEVVQIDLEEESERVISRLKTADDYRSDERFIADFNALA